MGLIERDRLKGCSRFIHSISSSSFSYSGPSGWILNNMFAFNLKWVSLALSHSLPMDVINSRCFSKRNNLKSFRPHHHLLNLPRNYLQVQRKHNQFVIFVNSDQSTKDNAPKLANKSLRSCVIIHLLGNGGGGCERRKEEAESTLRTSG